MRCFSHSLLKLFQKSSTQQNHSTISHILGLLWLVSSFFSKNYLKPFRGLFSSILLVPNYINPKLRLIEKGADINLANENGNTPLHLVIQRKKLEEWIEFLIEKGADINLANEDGDTPLLLAIKENKSEELLLSLIGKGANVNIVNKFRNTPLIAAIDRGMSEEFILYLIEKGAEIDIVDYSQEISAPLIDMINIPILKKWIAFIFLQNSDLKDDVELRQDFWKNCTKEIEILSKKMFGGGSYTISLKDIIKETSEKRLALISRNKRIIDEVQNASFKEKYPIFAPIIRFKLQEGRKRSDLVSFFAALLERRKDPP